MEDYLAENTTENACFDMRMVANVSILYQLTLFFFLKTLNVVDSMIEHKIKINFNSLKLILYFSKINVVLKMQI